MDSPSLNVDFINILQDPNAAANQIRLNGSGVALVDVDGDGLCDVYFSGLESDNALYKNLGNWQFSRIPQASGAACPGQYSTGCLFADVDGDGHPDLLVNGIGTGTRLFKNDGQGRFIEDPDSGLRRQGAPMSMAMADVDGDGDLDLYVTFYRSKTIRSTGLEVLLVNGRRMLKPEDRESMYVTEDGFLREHGEVDILYLNDGRGKFKPVSWTDGAFLDESGHSLKSAPQDWGLSLAFRDMNGDSLPDIYTCNDFWSPDRLWVNQGQGQFKALAREALPSTSSFSMGVDFGDLNRDGHDDFFVLDMLSVDHGQRMRQATALGTEDWPATFTSDRLQVERNTLFLNRGDFTFAELSQMKGLHASGWSWCPVFIDVDLDGYLDLLITNGYSFDTQDADAENRIAAMGPFPPEKVPGKLLMRPRLPLKNMAFKNLSGEGFKELSDSWGFNHFGISHGMALADLDNDGDLDVVVNNLNENPGFYQNTSDAPRISVRLLGDKANSQAVGSKLRLIGTHTPQTAQIVSGGRYLSSDDTLISFAADTTGRMDLEITWPDRTISQVEGILPNNHYILNKTELETLESSESDFTPQSQPSQIETPLFQDISPRLNHVHQEMPYDDHARQAGLPFKLSQTGPGISWIDLNEDGWEDLVIGSGKGGKMSVYLYHDSSGFTLWNHRLLTRQVTRDQTSLLPWQGSNGPWLLTGSSNHEDGLDLGSFVRGYDWNNQKLVELFEGQASSVGPMAICDIDGDGDLDLFVGGRSIPGRYPAHATSRLFLNQEGTLLEATDMAGLFDDIGMVQAATWIDLKNDGYPDLVLAVEWGSLRVFDNKSGRLSEATSTWGLSDYKGLWKSVTSGDFNGDGKLDFVAGNEGLNSVYQPHRPHPIRLYYADFDGNGSVEIVEAYYNESQNAWLPMLGLDALAKSWPGIKTIFDSHKQYSESTITDLLSLTQKEALFHEINSLETVVFINTGSRLIPNPLPFEAQISPVFGTAVADFDGDGHMDILLGQNQFNTHPAISPSVSGRGLFLKGKGDGTFESIPAWKSGVAVYGSQKACALNDFDRDGRMDAVMTQNQGPTVLLQNQWGKPGKRVTLHAGSGNPHGVGTSVRVLFEDGTRSPIQSVTVGSGYLSCNAPLLLIHGVRMGSQLEVRWPGGRVTRQSIEDDTDSIRFRLPGLN